MTYTPPPPAISDERIAAIEAEHAYMAEHGGNPIDRRYGAERVAIIARLRAAEAVACSACQAMATGDIRDYTAKWERGEFAPLVEIWRAKGGGK